ncbi:MAG: hypothetical protein AABX86_02845 [Nanoarchaeota archaeon]
MGLFDWLGKLRRLSDDERFCLEFFQHDEDYDLIRQYVKQNRIYFESVKAGFSFFEENDYLSTRTGEPALQPLVDRMNIALRQQFEHEWFHRFKDYAYETLPRLLARNIVGLDDVKKTLALQLFSKELLHILLVNDEGLDAHYFFEGMEALAEKVNCSIGMELTDTNTFALYDEGIVMIEGFEGVKRPIKQTLLPVMDHGIVDEEAGAKAARVRILAAAQPMGRRFSRTYENLKRQVPVDPALLHRFDLLFINRLSDVATRGAKLVVGFDHLKLADREFLRAYVKHAFHLDVLMPPEYEEHLADFLQYLQSKYTRGPKEVNERMIDGIKKLAKASARMELRTLVERRDLLRAEELVESSLRI